MNVGVSEVTWQTGQGSSRPYAECTTSQKKCIYNILQIVGNDQQSLALLVGGGGWKNLNRYVTC